MYRVLRYSLYESIINEADEISHYLKHLKHIGISSVGANITFLQL